jgi:HEPN domain-containing protein
MPSGRRSNASRLAKQESSKKRRSFRAVVELASPAALDVERNKSLRITMKVDNLILRRFEELVAKAEKAGEQPEPAEFHEWAVSALSLIRRVFGDKSIHSELFDVEFSNARDGYEDDAPAKAIGILRAALDDYRGGYLLNLRSELRAEVGDDILEEAKELLKAGKKDLACIVAGVALELAIKDLCLRHSVAFDHRSKLDALNTELRKSGVYNESLRKQISAWAALRNHAAHGEWTEYAEPEVHALIEGVGHLIGRFLG